jgi:BarA-like signal transduction histidine kinase
MISAALTFLRDHLNTFVNNKHPLGASEVTVILDRIVNHRGDPVPEGSEYILLTLVNSEEETVGKQQLPYFRTSDDKMTVLNPAISMNLYLQISTMSATDSGIERSGYIRALKMLDQVILCFQYRNVFNATQYPQLRNANIEKIILEPISLTFEQLNHLWATHGAKYTPSVLYKCRTIIFRETVNGPEQPVITEINAEEAYLQ